MPSKDKVRNYCLKSVRAAYQGGISHSSDEEILESIMNRDRWCREGCNTHRLYLRLLKQEAHRRGLSGSAIS